MRDGSPEASKQEAHAGAAGQDAASSEKTEPARPSWQLTPIAPEDLLLSVVIPVYNEESTLLALVRRVQAEGTRKEIILVDDGSNDGSLELLQGLESESGIRVLRHDRNRGKGAALKTGFRAVTGNVVIIQDADLEYDPAEYPNLLKPIVDGRADVVYGSRFLVREFTRVHLYSHYLGNRLLTFLSNIFTDLNLTDMETCYKAFRRSVVDKLELRSRRFDVEPEITAKIAKQRCRVYEVPISYSGRDVGEGKKISWRDGFAALWAILRYNLLG
ncbi:MAG: glycosyltransferase family 2 protein [Planctomycetota bacterium]